MPAEIRPLLRAALDKLVKASDPEEGFLLASQFGGKGSRGELPIVIQLPPLRPEPNESWQKYRERVQGHLRPLQNLLEVVMGLRPVPLLTANALQVDASPAQVQWLSTHEGVVMLELDPVVPLVEMDDAVQDIELANLRGKYHPSLDGAGVTVAVLDSGIDLQHPYLHVSDSVSTCGEDDALPGAHGTHCAGSIASQDSIYPGIAPGVTLLNVKVLNANGTGRHTSITQGIDAALDRGAQVLSLSLSFNHLPVWSESGHGWTCADGRCPLCTAVDNAVALDNAIVVVAAGNDHTRAEALRMRGLHTSFDTELGCPGQAREALTVGALTKRTFWPASFSSRGTTADGRNKPDLCAPGVNITSTAPVPRDRTGTPIPNPPRSSLFARMSGTSMATPIVAGAVALAIQKQINSVGVWQPAAVKKELLTHGVVSMSMPVTVVGAGRLDVSGL